MELAYLAAGIGAGITVFGASVGIGKLASAALEAGARQPELLSKLQTTMIIAAALIEGVALFSCVICFMLSTK